MSRRHEKTRTWLQKVHEDIGQGIARLTDEQLEFIEVLGSTLVMVFRLSGKKFPARLIEKMLERALREMRDA
jgi:hypothetical protein